MLLNTALFDKIFPRIASTINIFLEPTGTEKLYSLLTKQRGH